MLRRLLNTWVFVVALTSVGAAPLFASDDIGLVAPFMSTYCPTGWIGTNGGENNDVGEYEDYIFQDTYPVLYERAGAFGVSGGQTWGGGSRWYRLPDFRGYFLRVKSSGLRDTEFRVIGSTQSDTFQGHYHNFYAQATNGAGGTHGAVRTNTYSDSNADGPVVTTAKTDGVNGTPRISAETRPKNIAFLFCVKATSETFTAGGTSITMVPSTFTLVAISTQVAADLNPGIWGYFTAGDVSFWTGVLFAIVVIIGFKAGGMR